MISNTVFPIFVSVYTDIMYQYLQILVQSTRVGVHSYKSPNHIINITCVIYNFFHSLGSYCCRLRCRRHCVGSQFNSRDLGQDTSSGQKRSFKVAP